VYNTCRNREGEAPAEPPSPFATRHSAIAHVISGSILHFSSETAIAICAQDKRGRSHALPILTFGSTAGRSG